MSITRIACVRREKSLPQGIDSVDPKHMAECILATKGPKGDTGAQGPQGLTGPQGPAGSSSSGGLTYIGQSTYGNHATFGPSKTSGEIWFAVSSLTMQDAYGGGYGGSTVLLPGQRLQEGGSGITYTCYKFSY